MNTTMGLSLSVEDGVAIIVYDQVNSPINTLNSRIIPEFEQLFDRITADTKITSAVLMPASSPLPVFAATVSAPKVS